MESGHWEFSKHSVIFIAAKGGGHCLNQRGSLPACGLQGEPSPGQSFPDPELLAPALSPVQVSGEEKNDTVQSASPTGGGGVGGWRRDVPPPCREGLEYAATTRASPGPALLGDWGTQVQTPALPLTSRGFFHLQNGVNNDHRAHFTDGFQGSIEEMNMKTLCKEE